MAHDHNQARSTDFDEAVYAIAVGLVEELEGVGTVGVAPAPPDPNNPKYNGGPGDHGTGYGANNSQYKLDYVKWQKKVAAKAGRKHAYKRGAQKAKAKDAKKLAAQKAASAKILEKVKGSYQNKINALKQQQQNAQTDTEKQQLQQQIDALTQQQSAADATQAAIAKDPSSDKSLALQQALLDAAQKKPDDLTGMFMKMQMMQQMMNPGAPPLVAPPGLPSAPAEAPPPSSFEPAPGFDAAIPADVQGHAGNDEVIVLPNDPSPSVKSTKIKAPRTGASMDLDGFDQLIEVESYTEQTGDDLENDSESDAESEDF